MAEKEAGKAPLSVLAAQLAAGARKRLEMRATSEISLGDKRGKVSALPQRRCL